MFVNNIYRQYAFICFILITSLCPVLVCRLDPLFIQIIKKPPKKYVTVIVDGNLNENACDKYDCGCIGEIRYIDIANDSYQRNSIVFWIPVLLWNVGKCEKIVRKAIYKKKKSKSLDVNTRSRHLKLLKANFRIFE